MLRIRFSGQCAVALLAVAASIWVALLGFATWNSTRRSPGIAASLASTGVYAGAAIVCHQKRERSFSWHGAQVPVCGRCFGLYVGAAVGLGLVLVSRRRRFEALGGTVRLLLVAVGLNLGTLVVEWLGGPASNEARAAAGAVLGASGAYAIAGLIRADESDEVH